MEKPILVLKPSIPNGLIPIFLKHLFYSLIVGLVLFLVSYVLKWVGVIDFPTSLWIFLIWLAVLLLPTGLHLIRLANIKYYFFRTHVEYEYRLITIKKQSVPYSQIADITVKISLWDRLTNAGNITLHTAEERAPSLVLFYIRDPEKVEKVIYKMLYGKRK